MFDNAYFDLPQLDGTPFVTSNQLTVGINIRFIADSVATPRVILSKGDFTSRTLYVDFLNNTLRVKLGNTGIRTADISAWYGKQVPESPPPVEAELEPTGRLVEPAPRGTFPNTPGILWQIHGAHPDSVHGVEVVTEPAASTRGKKAAKPVSGN